MTNKETVINLLNTLLSKLDTVTMDDIVTNINKFSLLFNITEEEKEEIKNEINAKYKIFMTLGSVVQGNGIHKKWFDSRRAIKPMKFWLRYRDYLTVDKEFASNVVNSIDASSDRIIDLLGDPEGDPFNRRGLVIGDVQSGKTANYTALINKAVDVGYKVIVLLTGTLENLRKQTQVRLDEGFVGLDSLSIIKKKTNSFVGVGKFDSSINALSLTSTSSDFNTAAATHLVATISNINAPILLVIKKNKTILERVIDWLNLSKGYLPKVDEPILVIDDEADNASINTKSSEEDPTAINRKIREILNMFTKATYVGFTATPFANIFINPETDNDMIGEDLFPRDFIYALDAPSNYIGARTIFPTTNEDGETVQSKHGYMLKVINDEEISKFLPESHKSDYAVSQLPEDLYEALYTFMIANGIRDLRKKNKEHRSMLVNVSRFTKVQNQVYEIIDAFVRNIQRDIKANCLLDEERALKCETIAKLKYYWEKNYAKTTEFTWSQIQCKLSESIGPIVVRVVNQSNGAKNLNYSEYPDGLRLIAIGGNSLSRGLTLEGLIISYFYRNSKMYDTLMQMGRWFGYRTGYEDLCRIWLSQEAIDWYSYISRASDDLREEIKIMEGENKSPIDFGLKVRSDKASLLVTARNKMRSTESIEIPVSISGEVLETAIVNSDSSINDKNYDDLISLLVSLDNKYKCNDFNIIGAPNLWQNVPKEIVTSFIKRYKSNYFNFDFQTEELAKIIDNDEDGNFDFWDISFATGSGEEYNVTNNVKTMLISRSAKYIPSKSALQFSNARLGGTYTTKLGLDKKTAAKMEKDYTKATGKSVSDKVFLHGIKRNPILIIHLIKPKAYIIDKETNLICKETKKQLDKFDKPIVGLSIGFPTTSDEKIITIKYVINLIKFRELYGDTFEDEEDM